MSSTTAPAALSAASRGREVQATMRRGAVAPRASLDITPLAPGTSRSTTTTSKLPARSCKAASQGRLAMVTEAP
ncbi:MAG: hypothetical protein WKG00_41445 [Polyangiaceae bacterium]